jgi:hypothetical protein
MPGIEGVWQPCIESCQRVKGRQENRSTIGRHTRARLSLPPFNPVSALETGFLQAKNPVSKAETGL